MMKIDAHQHFWNYDPDRDSWITDEMKVLKNDFLPHQLQPHLKAHQFSGCVAVQAAQTTEETNFLLQLAKENAWIKGVVGWAELLSPRIEEQLEIFSEDKTLKGIRHIVQAEPPGFMLQPAFQHGIAALKKYRLTYDILIYPHQIPEAAQLIKKFPDQPFVVDHLAKPPIKNGQISEWKNAITELAAFENVYCKISGLVTEADWEQWTPADMENYLDVGLETFGTKRLLFGSDWPVCLLAASYKETVQLVEQYIRKLSVSEQNDIMGANAVTFYNL